MATVTAKPFLHDLERAMRDKNPVAFADAVKRADDHIKAMKRLARKPPKHPGSSYMMDSSGEYDHDMYTLGNLMVDARKMLARIKRHPR